MLVAGLATLEEVICRAGNFGGVDQIRISVLLPSLGTPKTLRAAVLSTLFALGPKDELLVQISGSEKAEVLGGIKDSRLRVFFSPTPLKVFEALNRLLSQSRGSIIGRMDSDDICLPGRFGAQLRFLERNKVDFVFSNAILFGSPVKPFGLIPQPPIKLNHEESGLYLGFSNPFVHPTMLARRSALESLSGYAELAAEDYDLWIRAWTSGFRFSRMACYGVLYRVHPTQVTQHPQFNQVALQEAKTNGSIVELKEQLVSKKLIEAGIGIQEAAVTSLRTRSLIQRIILSSGARRVLEFGKRGISGRGAKP
jgi:glycosyltransferase involved in cell wall biosynthesis